MDDPIVVRFQVRSEDAGEPVEFKLLADFDFPGTRLVYELIEGTFSAGHIDDLNRTKRFRFRTAGVGSSGCHTLTLIAAHKIAGASAFDDNFCPKQPDDSAYLTWLVNICENEGCATLPLQGDGGCPAPSTLQSCLVVRDGGAVQ